MYVKSNANDLTLLRYNEGLFDCVGDTMWNRHNFAWQYLLLPPHMHGGEETTLRYLICAAGDYFERHKNLFRISRLPIPTVRQKFSLGEDLHVNAFTFIDSDRVIY